MPTLKLTSSSPIPGLGPPIIHKHLVPGERILWTGQPNAREYCEPHRRRAFIATVLLLPVLIWQLVLAVQTFSLGYVGAGVVIAIILVAMWASPSETAKKAANIRYTVTTMRVVIERRETVLVSHKRMARVDIKVEDIRPTLKMGNGDCGSIRLGTRGLSIEHVDGARELYQKLLLDIESGTRSAQSYYSAVGDKAAPPLRLGETVIWSGRPDLPAYLLSETVQWVLWASVAFLFIATMIAGRTPAFTPVLILFGQVSAYGIPAVIILGALRASGLRYYITSERVLVRRPWLGPRWMERELSETTNAKVSRRLRGTGTIVFDKVTESFHGLHGGVTVWTEVTFHAVPDYKNVARIVATAQRDRFIADH